MGILDSMTQQSQPQTTEQSAVENPQGSQQQEVWRRCIKC